PDGQFAVSSSWDGTTRLWDIATGHELARLGSGGTHVQFSLDGRRLAFFPRPTPSTLMVCEVAATRALSFLREPELGPAASVGRDNDLVPPALWEVNFDATERLL